MDLVYKNDMEDADDVLLKYYGNIPIPERTKVMNSIREVKTYQSNDKPILLQIMEFPLPLNQKNQIILKNYFIKFLKLIII